MDGPHLLANAYEATRVALDSTEIKSDLYQILRTALVDLGGRLMLYHPDLAMEVLKHLSERKQQR